MCSVYVGGVRPTSWSVPKPGAAVVELGTALRQWPSGSAARAGLLVYWGSAADVRLSHTTTPGLTLQISAAERWDAASYALCALLKDACLTHGMSQRGQARLQPPQKQQTVQHNMGSFLQLFEQVSFSAIANQFILFKWVVLRQVP